MTRNKLYLLLTIGCLAGYVLLLMHPSEISSHGYQVCLIKQVTGLPCPSCGSTRSVFSIMEGHYGQALLINPLGFLVAFILFVTPLWMLRDVTLRSHSLYNFYLRVENHIRRRPLAIALTILIVINWVWNIEKGL